MPIGRMIPVAEIWFQTNGDLNQAFSLARVRGRVHLDYVPKEAVICALEEILKRLKGDAQGLLVAEDDPMVVAR